MISRAVLALVLLGMLAACGKKGVLELPPDQAPAAGAPSAEPPAPEPPAEEDEELLRDEG